MSTNPRADPLEALRGALGASDLVRIREVLSPLSSDERAALRRQALPEVTKGIQAGIDGVQNAWTQGRDWAGSIVIDDAFRRRLDRPGAALRAYRLAAVGIGLKKDVESSLFSARVNSFSMDTWQDEPGGSLSYQAGLLLLTRDEPWRDDVLYRLLDGELRTGFPNEGALELSLRLLGEGRGPQERVLAAAARHARRVCFWLWATDTARVFPWDTEVGQRVVWAALESRDEPLLASADPQGRFVQRVVELAAGGGLERGGLAALALRRLAEASRPFEANWWGRFADALQLSETEWQAHSDCVLDLIGAPNLRAVAVGLAAAGKLLRKRLLGPEELVPVLSLAVTAPVAGSAKSAVGLLRKCAEQDESVRLEAFTAALAGFQHAKPAVHDAVLQWLEADPWWRDDLETLSAAADAGVMAPAAAAARLDALMPADYAAPAEAADLEPETASAETSLRLELDRLMAADTTPERRAGLEELQSAVEGGALPPWSPPLHLRWSEGPAFSLPASVEETAQLLLRVTVSRLSLRDWDRIAYGIRLPITEAERQMLPRLLDPVLKLRTALEDQNPSARMADWGSSFAAIRVAEAWSGLPASHPKADNYLLNPHFSQGRVAQLRSILGAIKRGERQPPLGTPTHDSGWLDPKVFAERLLARGLLPEEELWELSAALYRLAPDPELRAEAWSRLGPVRNQWGVTPGRMLAAALAPGGEGERGQVALVNWLREQPHEQIRMIQQQAQDALATLQGLFGLRKPKPIEERSVNYHSLRMVTSALACRHETRAPIALELVRDRLPGVYRRLLDPKPKPPPDPHAWMMDAAWSQWSGLTDLLPEMSALSPSPWQLAPDYAFCFPPIGVEVARAILALDEFQSWGAMPSMAVELLRQPYCPVMPFVPRLIQCLSVNAEQAAIIVQLWAEALRDGRMRLTGLVDALVPALTHKAYKPRAVLGALELLARQYVPARDAAVSACDRVVEASVESMSPNDRVRLLEALLQWHSEAGTAPRGKARGALEGLAAKGKNNRAGTLARQLLDLSPRSARVAEAACREHDVRAMLAGLPQQALEEAR